MDNFIGIRLLPPLDLQHAIGYIRRHVHIAAYASDTLFTDDAITRVSDYTEDFPCRINQVCTTALMAGMIDHKTIIDETSVRKAIADLEHK